MSDQLAINTEVYPLGESSVGYYGSMPSGSPIHLIPTNILRLPHDQSYLLVSDTDLGLLFFMYTVTEQLKKCWGEYIRGHCRKICKITEIRQVLCENGRYCCLNILELEARKKITKPTRPKPMTYAITLPQDEDINVDNFLSPKANST